MASSKVHWADNLKISNISSGFRFNGIRQKVSEKVVIPDNIICKGANIWKCCLLGYFPGYSMPFHAIQSCANRAWKGLGLVSVTSAVNGFSIFRFRLEENATAVLARDPWLFGNKQICLQPWYPFFKFSHNCPTRVAVWIRLHGLPLDLWSEEGLSYVSSRVGRPLFCDNMTHDCARLEYARVCVELDGREAPIQHFEILCSTIPSPIQIGVEYEWKPKWCSQCLSFAHSCSVPQKDTKISPTPTPQHLSEKSQCSELESIAPSFQRDLKQSPLPAFRVVCLTKTSKAVVSQGFQKPKDDSQKPHLCSLSDVSQVTQKPTDVSLITQKPKDDSSSQAPQLPPLYSPRDVSQVSQKPKDATSSDFQAPQMPPQPPLQDGFQVSRIPSDVSSSASQAPLLPLLSSPRDVSQVSLKPSVDSHCSSSSVPFSATRTEVAGKGKRSKGSKHPS